MSKSEIIDVIAKRTGLTKKETAAVIDGFIETVRTNLKKKKRIDLRGFGNFKVVRRKARVARNPLTNTPVNVPAHQAVVFKPSKDLKEFVNGK